MRDLGEKSWAAGEISAPQLLIFLEDSGYQRGCHPNFRVRKILDAVKFDKKFESGKVRFVVTPRIGAAYVADNVTLDDIRDAVETAVAAFCEWWQMPRNWLFGGLQTAATCKVNLLALSNNNRPSPSATLSAYSRKMLLRSTPLMLRVPS